MSDVFVIELNLCSEFTSQHGGYFANTFPDYLCADVKDATKFDKVFVDEMMVADLITFDPDLWHRRPVKVT